VELDQALAAIAHNRYNINPLAGSLFCQVATRGYFALIAHWLVP
jgi:hypothetical protein